MKVRLPKIDYTQVRAQWAPNRSFAHEVNASSTIPSHVEPWLIKVFQEARELIPDGEGDLREQVDIFIAQEAQHYRQHNGFNRNLRKQYPGIGPYEEQLKSDYAAMLRDRTLKFKLAYAEGFETLGPPAAKMWFEDYEPFLQGADYEAVALWKWHMAEEFEHREVCFRLFRALYARTVWGRFWNGWLYRCYGVISAARHLGAFKKRVAGELLRQDRTQMSAAQRDASAEQHKAVTRFLASRAIPQLLKAFSPFYDPGRKPEPRGLREYLGRFEKGGDMGRTVEA